MAFFYEHGTFSEVFANVQDMMSNLRYRVFSEACFVVLENPLEVGTIFREKQKQFVVAMGDFDAMEYCAKQAAARINEESDFFSADVILDNIVGNERYAHFMCFVVSAEEYFSQEFDPTAVE